MKYKILIQIAVFFTLTSCSVINYSPSNKLQPVSYTEKPANHDYQFYYLDTANNSYLKKLRTEYGIDTMTNYKVTQLDKILTVLNWTSNQWNHRGSNKPSKSDALTILDEAKKGNNFRCVEYGIVSSASLNSIGIPARIVKLRTRDVEKVRYGAGHVVAEAYSDVLKKWIFIDGQWNIIPLLNGIPLNTVEFQRAIEIKSKDLKLINVNGEVSKETAKSYIKWISKYLYYICVDFDNKKGCELDYNKIQGRTSLTLVPIGAKEPTVFQRKHKMDYTFYTNSVNDIYQIPK